MPNVNRKKPQTIDFNEYLARLMRLKGDALKEWNRESTRRSNVLLREISEASKMNIEKFLRTPGAEGSLVEQKKHVGKISLHWAIDMEPGECRLRISADNNRAEHVLFGHPILNRITAKRFISLINEQLVTAALSLFEASAIHCCEEIEKSRPRNWRDRFMNEQIKRLEVLTAKPKKLGRPKNSRKDCLRKEDERNQLKKEVILAVNNLYQGRSDGTYQCQRNGRGACRGHDEEEINISLTAHYLNRSPGTLRNQLSKDDLKFRQLRKAALAEITN
jgi:hypothetical protein